MTAATIVVGTDGSESAIFAVQHAAALASAQGGVLHVVSAYQSDVPDGEQRARQALERTWLAIPDLGCPTYPHAVTGEPAAALTSFARRRNASLLVVGNRGTDSLVPWRRSICDDVERKAACPVVVVDTEASWHVQDEARPARVPRHVKVLAACMLAVFMALLDVTIVNVAFPDIERDFHGTPVSDLSWILNAYNVVLAALLVPAGRLADRRGRRTVFYSSVYLFVLGSLLCAVAPSVALLVAARVVQAIGAAGLIPSSLGLLLPEFPPEKRAMAVSLWAAAGAVAAAAGPSLGGLLVDAGGWRWAFLINLVMAVGFIPARRVLAERRDADSASAPDALGGLLLAVGVAVTALGIVKAPEWGWVSGRALACWTFAVVVIAALAVHTKRHPSPVLEPALLRIRSFRVASVTQLVYASGFYALLLASVLFLTQLWGYSVLTAGFAITPGPLAAAVGAAVAGHVAEHRGPRALVVAAALGTAAAMQMYRTLPDATPDYVGAWLPCQIVSGLSAGVVFAALSTATVMDVPENRVATGTALASCMRQIGAVFGIAILIAVLGAPTPSEAMAAFDQAYGLMALAAAATALVALRLPSRTADAIGEAPALARREPVEVPGLLTHETTLHGLRVVYRTAGDPARGTPIVLIHGLLDSGATWRKLAPVLAVGHYLIVPDLPGHGDTDGPPRYDYSMSGHARFVRDLLDQLGIGRCDVVGQSIGAAVALSYAGNWPERVRSLTIISAGGIGQEVNAIIRYASLPGSDVVLRALGSRPVLATLRAVAGSLAAARSRHAARVTNDVADTLSRFADASHRGAFVETVRAGVDRKGQRATAMHELASIPVPLLVMWGDQDRVIPHRHADLVKAVRPDARVVLIHGVGHSPHHRQPALVAEHVLEQAAAPCAAAAWAAA